MIAPAPPPGRHYGLDWLRIGAFGLLILYHVGMVFGPWNYHVKLPGPVWATVPMLATNPWRLALLFLVSGYASRALLARSAGTGAFAWGRSIRLLVPLAFGMAVVVPPQLWAEAASKYGYAAGYPTFLAHDYWAIAAVVGAARPAWNHLWFVAYLWTYTMMLAGVLAVTPPRVRAWAQQVFARVLAGPGVVALPMAWLLCIHLWLLPGAAETQALVGDWVAHAVYLPAFTFGFALAGAPGVLAAMRRWWPAMAVVAAASFAVAASIQWRWIVSTDHPAVEGQVFKAMRGVEGWSAIVALVGFADRHWNRDSRWRPMLTEAVFPFYLIHQTIIVLVAYALTPAGLTASTNFLILVVTTVAGCWIFYLVGRAIGPLRPLIGLKRRTPVSAAAQGV